MVNQQLVFEWFGYYYNRNNQDMLDIMIDFVFFSVRGQLLCMDYGMEGVDVICEVDDLLSWQN